MADETRRIVLELLARNKAAEGVNAFKKDIGGMQQNLLTFGRTLSSLSRAGGALWLARSLADSATAMAKARREGEGLFAAFLSGIPIVNSFAESIKNLAGELSGATAYREAVDSVTKWYEKSEALRESMRRSMALQGASPEEASRLQTGFAYLDRIKQIDALKEQIRAAREYNAELDKEIAMLEKMKEKAAFKSVVEKDIAELKGRRKALADVDASELYAMAKEEYQGKRGVDLTLQRLTPQEIARMSAEEDQMVIDRTREAMESVRHQDYLTRMERIESLRIYQQENAETLSEVEEANRLLNDEILSLERSRMNAMKGYQAELRDDMQNLALYQSEKFAEVSRSMESSMSGAFQSMITGGATWRDAMGQFFMDVANAFARMAADMAARAMMNEWIAPLMSGLAGALGGGVGADVSPTLATGAHVAHRCGRVGDLTDRRWVDPAIFANAPRFHGLLPGETAVIAQDDEVISRPGAGGLMKETKFDVRIHNEGSEQLEISQVESYMISDQRICDVTLRKMQTNLEYRKGMRGG